VSANSPETGSPRFWQRLCVSLTGALIVLLFTWRLWDSPELRQAAIAFGLCLPLFAPLPGLIRGTRRTFAWATLCVIPYFIVGITESIANPLGRIWSGSCLGLSLLLFVGLIAYLRTTRPGAVNA
jgi:uncharacterized membrane protein